MMPVYNDADFIEEVIEHLISQEIPLVVLDNGSTDGTYEICNKFLGKGILNLHQFKTDRFKVELVHRILYDMALLHSPDWVIRSDSDEILETGVQDHTLKQGIEQADAESYNLIQSDRYDFFMTDDDLEEAKSVKEKFRYYSYHGDCIYRAWKFFPGIMADYTPHYPVFPDCKGYKISPQKMIMRHYPYRSIEQAERKVKDRIRGTGNTTKKEIPPNLHYKKVLGAEYTSKVNHKILSKFQEDGNWDKTKKYIPFADSRPPKRNDLFTEDGSLVEKPKTIVDYKVLLEEQKSKVLKRRLRERLVRTKYSFDNKIRKKTKKNE